MSGKKKNKNKKSKKADQAEALSMINQVARNARTALSRHLLDIGLYAGQDSVMLALDEHDGQTPGAIAALLGVKAPTITKTIGRLAAQGFVRRQGSPNDGRMMLVFLTDAGRDQIRSVRKSQRRAEKAAFTGLTKKDIAQLLDLLAQVDTNIAATLGIAATASGNKTSEIQPQQEADASAMVEGNPSSQTD
ncbi:transcriptional regulator [Hoeflea sp. IMCC20628]|uniref:MarR family winged helix-turn-helix transcriptional regulator n=1 Tax=Hoeflea sp. IMCC20628 TaxID=1620421 RepID=UPI00063BE425|nr:MarR family transcriptional regulator [Hoeflea sp. IMCC20628]AKH99046.1 transcriptional regulator [Hoeflea sp. IMCC20628]